MEDKKALLILVLLATLCGEIRGKAIFGKDVATLWDKIRGEAIFGKDVDDNNDDGGDSASDLIYKANSILKNQTNSLFEEDILVDTARKEEVEEWISGTTTSKRAALLGDYRWPENTLYYRFNSEFLHAHDVFLEAIQEIASKSCIKFQEGSSPKGYYVSVGSADGCYSYVGNLETRGQELSIGDGCNHKGIIVHELLHALGFWHEQSRPDRDEYITIKRENIRSAFLNNFVKHVENEVEELGVPYDYDSLMHYGRKAFSRNGLDTIVPKGNPDRNIGQRNGLSTGDAEELRKYYNCPSNIPSPVAPGSMSCDFETGFCLWRNFDGEGKFLINKGPTRSSGTGPSGDHTSGTGQYIYFETSSPAVEGDSALIRSEQLMPSDNICVEFWYSMYGSTMGKLEMVTVTDLDSSTLPQARWSREGDQKETWKEARVTVSCQQPFYIIFKGTRGYSWRSDIALDDIAISPGPC